jgi:hypothetical protein
VNKADTFGDIILHIGFEGVAANEGDNQVQMCRSAIRSVPACNPRDAVKAVREPISPVANSSLTGCFWPILLKKSVSERVAFRQLKKRSISALLRKNQGSSVF